MPESLSLDFNPNETLFAELALPVPVPKLYTYRVPIALSNKIMVGQRAIVQFGKNKIQTGIVANLHNTPPVDYEAKYILELLDESEIIYPQQFKLYQWIADYYMCTLGEVINAALPSGLKLSSESKIQLHPAFDFETTDFDFSERERMLLQRLKQEELTHSEVAKLLGSKSIYNILKSLVSKEAIIIYEEVIEKYKPKTERNPIGS